MVTFSNLTALKLLLSLLYSVHRRVTHSQIHSQRMEDYTSHPPRWRGSYTSHSTRAVTSLHSDNPRPGVLYKPGEKKKTVHCIDDLQTTAAMLCRPECKHRKNF